MGMANSNHPNCQTILWHAFKLLLMYFNFDLSNSNQLSKDRRSIPIIFTMSIHKSLFMLNASLWTGRPMTSSQNVLYDIILIFLKYWLIGPLAHDPKAFLVLILIRGRIYNKKNWALGSLILHQLIWYRISHEFLICSCNSELGCPCGGSTNVWSTALQPPPMIKTLGIEWPWVTNTAWNLVELATSITNFFLDPML